MKRVLGLLMFVGAGIAVILITEQKHAHKRAQNKEHILYLDPILSTTTQQEISQFVEKEVKTKKYNSDFIELLVHQFPFINNINLRKSTSGIQLIDIEASAPLLSVNEHCILTHKGQVVSKDVYEDRAVNDLYSVSVAAATPYPLVSEELKKTIQSLSANLFDEFNITLVNDTECWLHDKSNTRFAILFNNVSVPSGKLLERCLAIKNNLQTRDAFNQSDKKKNNKTMFVADVRFKDQIIVRPSMGLHDPSFSVATVLEKKRGNNDIVYKNVNINGGQPNG
jgi:hypothetical protein